MKLFCTLVAVFFCLCATCRADTITGAVEMENAATQQFTLVDLTLFTDLNGGGVNVWCASEAGVPNTSGCSAFFADALDDMNRLADTDLIEPAGFMLPTQFSDPAPVPEPATWLLLLTGITLIGLFYCARMMTSSK